MSPKNAAKAEEVVQDQIPDVETMEQSAVDENGKPKLQLVDSDEGQQGAIDQMMADAMMGMEPVQQPVSSVQTAKFTQLNESPVSVDQNSMDLLLDVDLDLSVELGRANVPVREILQLGSGSIVELNKLAGDSVDVLVNGRLIARGEVVVVDENFGVRITEILNPSDRISRLG
jgi:flagellar motor switch protein FliN